MTRLAAAVIALALLVGPAAGAVDSEGPPAAPPDVELYQLGCWYRLTTGELVTCAAVPGIGSRAGGHVILSD